MRGTGVAAGGSCDALGGSCDALGASRRTDDGGPDRGGGAARYAAGVAASRDDLFQPTAEDITLVAALRDGDEQAFARIVDELNGPLLRLAGLYVQGRAAAEEVVQDTWLGVIRGLDRFEARSSFRTWVFRIATNRARTRGGRERRDIPLSALLDPADDPGGPALDPERFMAPGEQWAGGWAVPPHRWAPDAETHLAARETRALIRDALDQLSPAQRFVMTLRDIDGWGSEEVCAALEITPGNQRVLLHRARSRVRAALERHLAAADRA
jgi:RNA polymerase sigma-70 factor (ECF subfamily)